MDLLLTHGLQPSASYARPFNPPTTYSTRPQQSLSLRSLSAPLASAATRPDSSCRRDELLSQGYQVASQPVHSVDGEGEGFSAVTTPKRMRPMAYPSIMYCTKARTRADTHQMNIVSCVIGQIGCAAVGQPLHCLNLGPSGSLYLMSHLKRPTPR